MGRIVILSLDERPCNFSYPDLAEKVNEVSIKLPWKRMFEID